MSLSIPEIAFGEPMKLGECPLWHPTERALYWIDIEGRAVHRLDPSNNDHRTWQMPSEPGCIAHCSDGRLLVALRTGLMLLETSSGLLTKLADAPYDATVQRFNDGRTDRAGRFWVGAIHEPRDQPSAALYYVEQGEIHDSGKRCTVSNGLAFSPDDKTLYHADTAAHSIMAWDFNPDTGELGKGHLFAQFSSDRKALDYGGRPDGAAVDAEGAYWCAMFEGGRILRLSPQGVILLDISVPVRCPTMVAFGGEDLRTLYITSARHNRTAAELAAHPNSGCLFSLRTEIPGLAEPAYKI